MTMSVRKTILCALALALVVGTASSRIFWTDQARAAANEAVVEPPRLVFAAGVVQGVEPETDLHFEVLGKLDKLHVQEGDSVTKGQVLATLDDAVWKARRAEAEANLHRAKAERERLINGARNETRAVSRAQLRAAEASYEQAKRRYERAQQLKQRDAIAHEDFDDVEAELAIAEAERSAAQAKVDEIAAEARRDELRMADARAAAARAQLELADVILRQSRLVAPIDGTVLKVNGEPGELMTPSASEPLMVVADLKKMHVKAYIEELDAITVQPGMPAVVTVDGDPDARIVGVVVFCHPYMVPKKLYTNSPAERIDVKVREILVELDEPGSLMVGMPVDVSIDPDVAPGEDGRSEGLARR